MVLSRAPYTFRHADSDEMILLYIHTNLEEKVSRQKSITLYRNNSIHVAMFNLVPFDAGEIKRFLNVLRILNSSPYTRSL